MNLEGLTKPLAVLGLCGIAIALIINHHYEGAGWIAAGIVLFVLLD